MKVKLIPMWKTVANDLTHQLLLSDFTNDQTISCQYELDSGRALASDKNETYKNVSVNLNYIGDLTKDAMDIEKKYRYKKTPKACSIEDYEEVDDDGTKHINSNVFFLDPTNRYHITSSDCSTDHPCICKEVECKPCLKDYFMINSIPIDDGASCIKKMARI